MSEEIDILCAGCEERPVSEAWDSDIYCDECLALEAEQEQEENE